MFCHAKKQRACTIGRIRVGGQPGENPPVLIGSMFHKGDKILLSRRSRHFDRARARETILLQEELSRETGIPAFMSLVANNAEEMKAYLDFYAGVSDLPFALDMWRGEERLRAAQWAVEQGLGDRLVYNSVGLWDKDLRHQVAVLRELGVRAVVVQAYDPEDPTVFGRIRVLRRLLEEIGEESFSTILVDTAVVNLPAAAFSFLAARLAKEEFGWPAGCAPANGVYLWEKLVTKWGPLSRAAVNGSIHALATVLWNDFLFYGPAAQAPAVFPAVAAAHSLLSTLIFVHSGELRGGAAIPLRKNFPNFAIQLLATDLMPGKLGGGVDVG